jgi:hypothetical protein
VPDSNRLAARRSASALPGRDLALIAIGLVVGAALALIDSRPHFDDTGVIVALLLAVPIPIAAISGRRPWLWAALVGGPLPIVELAGGGSTASLVAPALTAVGAGIGYLVSIGLRSSAI